MLVPRNSETVEFGPLTEHEQHNVDVVKSMAKQILGLEMGQPLKSDVEIRDDLRKADEAPDALGIYIKVISRK